MAASDAQIAQLRRMTAEPTEDTYSDEALAALIESYPLLDGLHREPYRVAPTVPLSLEVNPNWTPTYDINAAAAAIWDEKAAGTATLFDFSVSGGASGAYNRKQQHDHALRMARHYRARRSAHTITLRPHPTPTMDVLTNASEE